jgi:hypothetical protein
MATIAAQITELESELVLVKSQLATAQAGGGSFTLGDFSVTGTSYNGLRSRRTEIEKSLQRLYRGGRGMPVALSYPVATEPAT